MISRSTADQDAERTRRGDHAHGETFRVSVLDIAGSMIEPIATRSPDSNPRCGEERAARIAAIASPPRIQPTKREREADECAPRCRLR